MQNLSGGGAVAGQTGHRCHGYGHWWTARGLSLQELPTWRTACCEWCRMVRQHGQALLQEGHEALEPGERMGLEPRGSAASPRRCTPVVWQAQGAGSVQLKWTASWRGIGVCTGDLNKREGMLSPSQLSSSDQGREIPGNWGPVGRGR